MEDPEIELNDLIEEIITDKSLHQELMEPIPDLQKNKKKRGRPKKLHPPIQPKRKRGRPKNHLKRNLRLFLWVYFTLDMPNSQKMRNIKYREKAEDIIVSYLSDREKAPNSVESSVPDKTQLQRDKAIWGKYLKNDVPKFLEEKPIEIDGKFVKSTKDFYLLSEDVIRKLLAHWVQDAIRKYNK